MENEICISENKISRDEILKGILAVGDEQVKLHSEASAVRDTVLSNKVYFRGLIEFSNICTNDCNYCGIRKSRDVERFSLTKDEIMECVKFCHDANYGSIVLQSGERQDSEFVDFVEDVVRTIKEKYPKIGITLSVGEHSKESYERLFAAGAHRYLLRIETSSKEHYSKIHPEDMSFDSRLECLKCLKEVGFQVGTGVMIGTEDQTDENLADDLLFFKDNDIDMIGMGPYIPYDESKIDNDKNLNKALNMISLLRIMMPKVNIASTTALQAIDPLGREKGFGAGANIIMPIVTPTRHRQKYQLYRGKPCLNETSEECMVCITKRIESADMIPAFGEWGDSLHFKERTGDKDD